LQVEETQGVVSFSGFWYQTSVGNTDWVLRTYYKKGSNSAHIINTVNATLVRYGSQEIAGNV